MQKCNLIFQFPLHSTTANSMKVEDSKIIPKLVFNAEDNQILHTLTSISYKDTIAFMNIRLTHSQVVSHNVKKKKIMQET